MLISILDFGLLESKDCCFVHFHIFGTQDSNRHGELLICTCWQSYLHTSPAITLSVTHLFSSLNVAGKPRISSTGQGPEEEAVPSWAQAQIVLLGYIISHSWIHLHFLLFCKLKAHLVYQNLTDLNAIYPYIRCCTK